MADFFRWLRIFGDFSWPPVVGEPQSADTVKGVVEVYYCKQNTKFGAVLVWTPNHLYGFDPPTVDPSTISVGNVFEIAKPDLVKLFGMGKSSDLKRVVVSIDKPGSDASPGPRLRFDGAWLLDQFERGAEDLALQKLRWPLVRTYRTDQKADLFSSLVVGLASVSKERFRLDLAIPMPVRQTRDAVAGKVLAFSTIHDPTAADEKSCGETVAFVAGSAERPGWNQTFPVKTRLGQFGIAANKAPVPADNMTYISYVKGIDPKQLDRYWPLEDETSIHQALDDIGVETGLLIPNKSQIRHCSTPNEKTDASVSITLSKTGFDYRSALQADSPTAGGKYGDIIIVDKGPGAGDKHFYIRARSEIGGWFSTRSNRLNVHLSCTWDIGDGLIRRRLISGEVEFRPLINLGVTFSSPVPANLGGSVNPASLFGLPVYETGDLFKLANESARVSRTGLLAVSTGQPQSILPRLAAAANQNVAMTLEAVAFSAACRLGGTLDLSPDVATTGERFRLTIARKQDVPGAAVEPVLELKLAVPSFDEAFRPDVKLKSIQTGAGAGLTLDDPFAAFKIEVAPKASNAFSTRLGALSFAGTGLDDGDERSFSVLRIGSWIERPDGLGGKLRPSGGAAPEDRCGAQLMIGLRLAVTSITPTTVDIPYGQRDRRRPPLIIEHHREKTGGSQNPRTAPYILDIVETLNGNDDRHLVARIIESSLTAGSDPESVSYTLLADEPFSLLRFSREPLSRSGDETAAVIATFDSDQRTWELKLTQPEYRFTLPPQSVGESSDKPRRLEIHDIAAAAGKAVQPYPAGQQATDDGLPLRSHLVEFRLTPSAQLWIKPNDLERRYFLPEWAAHDIFRMRNDFGLGAALLRFSAEFLYGLSVGVDVQKETGPSRFARVAEVEALTGSLPSDKQTTMPDEQLLRRWRSIRQAMKRRHERLEVWTPDYGTPRPFAPARFSDGVSFALRHRALHRPPLARSEVSGETGPTTIVADNAGARPRFHDQGLGGGALWPLESSNVLDALLDRPESTGGTIERVALSPTGGDADQTARFLNGIVSIISETRGGFVQRQRVEILGRVGVFWHRAKHVVVYERTVSPSAQFAPYPNESPETRTRRPVIRKVAEFIELLQPLRSFPDHGSAPERSVGFLDSVRFKTTTINVDSAWGSDIGTIGYEIPLWNPRSARERPQVYAKPAVSFVTIGEGSEERPLVALECLDPDNLYFFSDIRSGTPNTDGWHSRLGIDRAPNIEQGDPRKTHAPRRQPNVSRITPGLRRFTWRLAPGTGRTQLNATRSDKPIYVGLESITFMRAAEESPRKASIGSFQESLAPDKLQPLKDATNQLDGWTPGEMPPAGTPFAAVAQAHAALGELVAAVAAGKITDPKLSQEALRQLKTAVSALATTPGQALNNQKAQLTALAGQLSADANKIIAPVEEAERKCERFVEDAVQTIRRRRLLIGENVRITQAEIKAWVNDLKPPYADAQQLKSKLTEEITANVTNRLGPVFEGGSRDFGSLARDIEQARAIGLDVQSDIQQALKRTLGRLDALKASYNDSTPWSANRLSEFERRLVVALSSVDQDIDAAVAEGQQRLATELGVLGHQVGAAAGRALEMVARAQASLGDADLVLGKDRQITAVRQLLSRLNDARRGIDARLTTIKGQLAAARRMASVTTHAAALDKIIKEASDFITEAGAALATLQAALAKAEAVAVEQIQAVNAGFKDLQATADKCQATIKELATSIQGKAEELIAAAKDAGVDIFNDLGNSVKDAAGVIGRVANEKTIWAIAQLAEMGKVVDPVVDAASRRITDALTNTAQISVEFLAVVDEQASRAAKSIASIEEALGSGKLVDAVIAKAVVPAVDELFATIDDNLLNTLLGLPSVAEAKRVLVDRIDKLADRIADKGGTLDRIAADAFQKAAKLSDVCQTLSKVKEGLASAQEKLLGELKDHLLDTAKLDDLLSDVAKYKDAAVEVERIGGLLRATVSNVTALPENVRAYGDRIVEAVQQLDKGGIGAAPSNFLKLYSAATSSPELAMLELNVDRIRSQFDEYDDLIKITKSKAQLARLGDALKSMGLDLPIDGISDRVKIDTTEFAKRFTDSITNFGGIDISRLLKDLKGSESFANAVHVSHDFDKKAARAWVQVDIDGTLPGRSELFALGPFALYFRDSRLVGQMRLEASKDTDQVEETGVSMIATTIEAVVAGQPIVTLDDVRLQFSKEQGLKFHVDPANIRLNEVFRFIQETLSAIFPDKVGGLSIIKEGGVPIGVEHEFCTPNLGIMAGTSGVTNIQIANKFRLVAFPDFIISDRFNLSSAERPFLFSIFIIGGTGYIQVDTEYRPFDDRLMVVVEAAAGGSAALGFTFGPVSGSVFFAISIAIAYRKIPDQDGGGLTVSLVLVIAGDVSLWGIASVHLGLMLRMTYRDSGQIDATGTLSVSVTVCRFLKLNFRTEVVYKLRDGSSTTVTRSSSSVDVDQDAVKEIARRIGRLENVRRKA